MTIIEMAEELPKATSGKGSSPWADIAKSLRDAGKKAARIDRKSPAFTRETKNNMKAAGLDGGQRTINGEKQVWVWLLDEEGE